MSKRSFLTSILVALALIGSVQTVARTLEPGSGDPFVDGYHILLDPGRGRDFQTHYPRPFTHASPMNTLFHPGATAGITMVSIGFFPTMAPANFIGNFFTAPGDFPTSYWPFFVTGAFARLVELWETRRPRRRLPQRVPG